jgi:hypothetical protein
MRVGGLSQEGAEKRESCKLGARKFKRKTSSKKKNKNKNERK